MSSSMSAAGAYIKSSKPVLANLTLTESTTSLVHSRNVDAELIIY